MIDPTDERLVTDALGDADVMPSPMGGRNGRLPVTDYDAPDAHQPEMFVSRVVTLAAAGSAGDRQVINVGDRPEYWAITGLTTPITNTEFWIWTGRAPEGLPVAIISGTGRAKISGVGGSGYGAALWIESRGSAGGRILVRAIRGFDHCDNSYV